MRDYLEGQLGLHVPPPYMKPPKKGTVLGDVKETIRFNDAYFLHRIREDVNQFIDSISFGFGEKGYYYDIHLNHNEVEMDKFGEISAMFLEVIEEMEQIFEVNLPELYYDNPPSRADMQMFEISNFHATVEDDGFLERNFQLIHSLTQLINEDSDVVVEDGLNFGLPEISIDIYNDYIFESLDLFREKAKPLFDQRFFKIKQLLSDDRKSWVFSSRGVPLRTIIKIISLFK